LALRGNPKEGGDVVSSTNCCHCGTEICLTYSQEHELRRTKGTFYCPAGHRQHFTGGCEHKLELDGAREFWKGMEKRLRRQIDAMARLSRTCPWPSCRRGQVFVYSRRDGLIAHMERAHGMPSFHLALVEDAESA
jgi:hypothetical protein